MTLVSHIRWRKPQFGLGALLVGTALVALIAASFVWQMHLVRTRNALADDITARGGSVYAAAELVSDGAAGGRVSSFRQWLGDRAVGTIYLPPPNFSQDDFRTVKKNFPEAHIWPPTPVASNRHIASEPR
jgi:hypothetical protein